nr:type I polyketide synthase [Nonomuraea polychroma]
MAIVGIACRLPGAEGPEAFWQLLRDGRSAISELLPDRVGAVGGVRHAGLLDDVGAFDAGFFGISPREAVEMDPQQRLMLELAWEALEDAAIVPGALVGTGTGVFVGTMGDDYAALLTRRGGAAVTSHTMAGTVRGIIANRVSYTLGLRGPSVTIDAAQASSLVAVHLACQSLREGESSLALAGGVNLIVGPESTARAAGFGALSPDGRCYTFDARANGFVRGEGGAFVVLKPLAAALADGDPVYGVILGSAVNNDGGTEALTVPSREAQEEVIRLACRRASVDPAEVQVVELHGTGTKVGDPIEAAALGAVFGPGRERLLVVGSAKTNVGHLEGAAGVVGLIKMALAVRHGEVPPSLNFETPNPRIDLDALGLRVATALGPWPGAAPLAGVSSFGMGGTNCHVVLGAVERAGTQAASAGEDPADAVAGVERTPVVPWVLSARDPGGLAAQAERLRAHLEERPGLDPGDVGWSLAATRTSFEHRAVVLGRDRDALLAGLDALATGRGGVVRGRAAPGGLAVLFTGQGSQYPGMGRDLYASYPMFAAAFDEVCRRLDPALDHPLREVVFGADRAGLLDQTMYTQTAIFAVEVALFRLAEHWGLRPDHLIGHSIGELSAAHVAGVLSLDDACTLVAARARLMQDLPPGGAMVSVEASEPEVLDALAGSARVAVAAVNSPGSVVVSGDEDAVAELAARWESAGRKVKRLRVSHAFHSPRMDPMLTELEEVAAGLTYHAPSIPIVSNVTGRIAEDLDTPAYWARHVRQAVRFRDGIETLRACGTHVYLELGPGGVLTGLAERCLASDGAPPVLVPTLSSRRPEPEAFLTGLARAHVNGVPVRWTAECGRRVPLPTYAFQRRRYWPELAADDEPRPAAALESPPGPAPQADTGAPGGDVAAAESWAGRAAGLPDKEQEHLLLGVVRAGAAAVLGHSEPEAVDPDRTFKDLGFDSLSAVELRDRLTEATGLTLPAGLTFSHPTPAALVKHLRSRLADLDDSGTASRPVATPVDEPIAIVAMACRYPGGARSPDELWDLVAEERDAIGAFPDNRGWDLDALYDPRPGTYGTSYVKEGGFLYDADLFDASFFGISPREALAMDPQQRLLLETSWEALERTGAPPTSWRGAPVGVFVGAMSQDYGPRLHEAPEGLDGYLLTGATTSVASGRIAYTLGLTGPAVTVDTACSSSLVAIHLAAQALRRGECSLALAGGVAVMASPGMFVEFSRQRGLAPDGRSKAFSAGADGTSWSEGVGLVVMERLSDAQRNGHRVLAVLRGSAINQDGASNGLTAPSGTAQQDVIRQALADARLSPCEVDAVEAHGTGTVLGDPIEAEALIAAYGRDRARPLYLGSLKSNIGHTQAAAGVGGVIKMVQAMRHGRLPRTLHADQPSPHVDWSGGVELLSKAVAWPETGQPRRAGVSSFGISGTNAHVILEQAPGSTAHVLLEQAPGSTGHALAEQATGSTGHAAPVPLLVTGHSAAGLRSQAQRLLDHLQNAEPGIGNAALGAALATTRSVLEHRAVIVAADREEALRGLGAVAHGADAPNVISGSVSGAPGRTVFVFPGQGSQWAGMALDLLDSSPVFRERMRECERAMSGLIDWSLEDALRNADLLERVDVVQPALFAVMVSLAELWRSYGVVPDAVVGHSQGEISAACVAGALSLEDAARVVVLRSQALVDLAGSGGLVSVPLPHGRVSGDLDRFGGRLNIATRNGPSSTVVAGDSAALDELLTAYQADGVRARRIPVDYASHSPHVEPLRERLLEDLRDIEPRACETAFYSTVTGGPLDTATLDAGYWYRNIRQTVEFEQAIRALSDDGYRVFIEASPHPVLTAGIRETLEDASSGPSGVVGSLRRDDGGLRRFTAGLAEAFVHGAPVDWSGAFEVSELDPVQLPTYAFQRTRYWLRAPAAGVPGIATADHPLLGATIEVSEGEQLILTGALSRQTHPWLADHAIAGTALLPGAALVELALHAARDTECDVLEELNLESPLLIPESGQIRLQVIVGVADDDGRRAVGIHSRPDAGGSWTCHGRGMLAARPAGERHPSLAAWPPPGAEPVAVAELYADLADQGYEYGPAFQGLQALWRGKDGLYGEVRLAEPEHADALRFGIHPALLDAALHALQPAGLLGADDQGQILLPFSWTGVALHATGATAARVHWSLTEPDGAALTIAGTDGLPILTARSLITRPAPLEQLAASAADPLYRLDWLRATVSGEPSPGTWATLGSLGGLAAPRYENLAALKAAIAAGAPVPDAVFTTAPLPAALTTGSVPAASAQPAEAASTGSTAQAGTPAIPSGEIISTRTPSSGDKAAAGAVPDAARQAMHASLVLLQEWLADPDFAGSRLVMVTNRAVTVAEGETPELVTAPLWGLVRAAQTENPGRFLLLDLGDALVQKDPGDLPDPRDLAADQSMSRTLAAALALDEPQIAVREGGLFLPRLARMPQPSRTGPAATETDPALTESGPLSAGTVLVTGATGTVGRLLTRHLVSGHGARRLLLTSRRGRSAEGAEEFAAELAALGADVTIAACDLADRDAVAELLGSIPAGHPLTAVVHAAGVLDDGVIENLTPDRLDTVLRPKVDGAWHLHQLTRHMNLSAFILLSSVTGLIGSAGQAAYCAANTFLDALAEHRRAAGLPASSHAWGLWADASGMTGNLSQADLARLSRGGLVPIAAADGLSLFEAALAAEQAVVVPAKFDLAGLRRAGEEISPVLRGLVRAPIRRAAAVGGDGSMSWREQLAALPDGEQLEAALELLRTQVAVVLGHGSPGEIDAERAFKELGFDSLMALDLRNRLAVSTGMRLSPTLIFDHPSIRALARHLQAEATGHRPAAPAVAPAADASSDDPIAIVGIGCRFPGGVHSAEDLWRVLADGRSVIGDFPSDRGWNVETLYDPDPDAPGKSYARHGSFLEDAAGFDADFFGISPREALAMDPQQRLLLETAWETLERAGLDPTALRGSATGVFTGVMYGDYGDQVRHAPEELEGFLRKGSYASVASGRISYTFGFEGPAVSIDTACSSSLVAIHLAAQSLRSGECDLALAGGVTVMATPATFIEFSRQRGLAPDGRCKPFAAAADGTAFGEGVGLLLLERLSAAERQGHRVLAVIRGSAVNQDGASNGLTAPNGPSQQRVIHAALANARLRTDQIDAVEAHGTGTTLGDPIEAQALLATYGHNRPHPLYLGSVKSNIGHTQAAAGVAGIIKMVQAIHHGLLPASLHIDQPTPHVDWSTGNITLLTHATPWPQTNQPRRAGISSFGISGTNAHLILEAAPTKQDATPDRQPPHGQAHNEQAHNEQAQNGQAHNGQAHNGQAHNGQAHNGQAHNEQADEFGPQPALPWLLSARSEQALRAYATHILHYRQANPHLPANDIAHALGPRTRHPHRAAILTHDETQLRDALHALAHGQSHPALITHHYTPPPPGTTAFLFSGQGTQRHQMGRDLYHTHPTFAHHLDHIAAQFPLNPPLKTVMFAPEHHPHAHLLHTTQYTQPALFTYHTALAHLLKHHHITPDYLTGHSIGLYAAAHHAGILTLPDATTLITTRATLMATMPPGAMTAIHATEEEITPTLLPDTAIAATNTPTTTIISGNPHNIATITHHWHTQGRKTTPLNVNHAYHSPHTDPILKPFHHTAQTITYHPPTTPILCNLTGQLADPHHITTPHYWTTHIRQPVRHTQTLTTLHQLGATTHHHLTPHPHTLATLHTHTNLPWPPHPHHAQPPTYPFQHHHYWLNPPPTTTDPTQGFNATHHPLLTNTTQLPDGARLFTGSVSRTTHPWVADHQIHATTLLPGTALVEAVLQLGIPCLQELVLHTPLDLTDESGRHVQVLITPPAEDGATSITIRSRRPSDEEWQVNATGTLTDEPPPPAPEAPRAWPPAGAQALDVSDFYERLSRAGLDYGPAFQGMRAAWRLGEEVFAEIELAEDLDGGRFAVHPALLDAALHPILLANDPAAGIMLPYSWSSVRLHASAGEGRYRVRVTPAADDGVRVELADGAGRPVASIGALTLRRLTAQQLRKDSGLLFEVDWVPARVPSDVPPLAGPRTVLGEAEAGNGDGRTRRHRDLAALRAAMDGGAPRPGVVVARFAGGPDGDPHVVAGEALALVQGWLSDDRFGDTPLVVVTRRAVAAGAGEDVHDLAAAPVWGLVRAAQSENPGRFVLVDTDGDLHGDELPAALASGEPQLALRQGVWLAPRLARASASGYGDGAKLDPEGTVLITGGTGTLGGLLARHLATHHGIRHLLLLSRQGPDAPGAADLQQELTALGAETTIAACDTADPDALRAVLGAIPQDRPLRAVVHAAGTVDDATIPQLTGEHMDTVLRPKADAAWNLHQLTASADLSAFVLFSSVAGVLGSPGQGNYAAANTYLDALAHHRHAHGRPAISLAWGLWETTSTLTARLDAADRGRLGRTGVAPLTDEEALTLFDAALERGRPFVVPARIDTAGLERQAASGLLPQLLRGLVRVPQRGPAAPQALADRLAGLAKEEQQAMLLEFVRSHVAAVLGHDSPARVDADRGFLDMGFSSLTAVELRNRLNGAAGLRLPTTVVFDHATPRSLADYLRGEFVPNGAAATDSVLTGLDLLEADLVSIGPDDRLALSTRLRSFLLRLTETQGSNGSVLDAIDAATDDEVFQLIDNELGLS